MWSLLLRSWLILSNIITSILAGLVFRINFNKILKLNILVFLILGILEMWSPQLIDIVQYLTMFVQRGFVKDIWAVNSFSFGEIFIGMCFRIWHWHLIVESVPDRYCQISDNVCSEGFRDGDGRIFELVSSHLGNYLFVFVFVSL